MKWRKIQQLLLALVVSLVLVGCSGGTSKEERPIKMGVKTELSTLDTLIVGDIESFSVLGNTVEGLYRLDADNQPQPAIAEKTDVSEDGKTYTFHLRDAKWSNGEAVTAHDFVYAWQTAVNPDKAARYAYMFANIVNGEAAAKGQVPVEELGVKAIDDKTFEVKLNHPVSYFLSVVAFAPFYPQNQAFVEEHGEAYGTSSDKMLYNGPFTVENWDGSNQTWQLVKNENYWDKDNVKPHKVDFQVIKEVPTALSLFENGEVDDVLITGEAAKQLQGSDNFVVEPQAATNMVHMNYTKRPEFKNKNLRKALSLVIDRDQLANGVLADGAVPAENFVPHDFVKHPNTGNDFADDAGNVDQALRYDVEAAKQALEEAKKELGQDQFHFEILAYDDPQMKLVAQYLQGQWQNELEGVTVDIRTMPKQTALAEAGKKNFDLFLSGWAAILPDAINLLDILNTKTTANFGDYNNPKVNELLALAEGDHATDVDQRWQDMIEAQNTMVDDYGFLVLYHPYEGHLRNPNLKGFVYHSVGAKYDFRQAELVDAN
ncbi:peptide ABC transporter substrate-binding protein [Aerococcus urinae]